MSHKELRERQAGRITEIQNLKIGIRNVANETSDLRKEIAAGPSLPHLYVAVLQLEEAIKALDCIKREDL